MPSCPAFDPLGSYATGLLDFVDCQATTIGREGYAAVALGSPFGLALTGLLTIFVALFGYRMMLGETPTIREIVISAGKIGFVLALATQWPAYQALVYDGVIGGPC